jgi:hypothetical protein
MKTGSTWKSLDSISVDKPHPFVSQAQANQNMTDPPSPILEDCLANRLLTLRVLIRGKTQDFCSKVKEKRAFFCFSVERVDVTL